MGLVYSVIRRFKQKATTKERLERIEEDIGKLETSLKRHHQLKRKYVWLLLLTSLTLYIVMGAIFYLWYLPKTWSHRLLHFVPFLLFPFLVFLLKKLLHYIFVSRISKTSRQLEDLKKEKRKILENVMETETYKVAKEILQKFDPERNFVEKETPRKRKAQKTPVGSELRKRNPTVNSMQTSNSGLPPPQMHSTPLVNGTKGMMGMRTPSPQQISRFQTPNVPRGMTPRVPNAPILPRDRSVVDKIVEYFVGDGPSNRFALICGHCLSHNGMALAEEFEYISYKCCYCGHFNAARKKRLVAPKEEPLLSESEKKDSKSEASEDTGNMDQSAEEEGSQKSDQSGSPKTNKNIEKEESLETNNKMNRHTQCQSDINSKVK